jgi:hypothetical protein
LAVDPHGFRAIAGHGQVGLVSLAKVEYDPTRQFNKIQQALDVPVTAANYMMGAQKAFNRVKFLVPTFKNADFLEEEEWRLIFAPQPNPSIQLKFRVARGMVIPYFRLSDIRLAMELGTATLPLRQVCVGPCTHKTLNAESAFVLLGQAGYVGVPVVMSTTPYRS